MKKHNEGYVLAMVMTVIAVLALIVATMLSIALRNVQAQQASLARIQEKYKAEGQLEISFGALGDLEKQIFTDSLGRDTVQGKIRHALFSSNVTPLNDGNWYWEETIDDKTQMMKALKYNCTIMLQAKCIPEAKEAVTGQLILEGTATADQERQGKYTIDIGTVTFKSYETFGTIDSAEGGTE